MTGAVGTDRRRAGLTIVELLIVISVLGILGSIVVLRVDFVRYQVDAAMEAVGTTFLAAQRQAVTRQHDVIVLLDEANNTIRVHRDADSDGVVAPSEPSRVMDLGEGVVFGRGATPPHAVGPGPLEVDQIRAGLAAITFHRNGSASEAAAIYLTSIRNENTSGFAEDSRLLFIDRATGRTSWMRYVNGAWERGF